MDHFLRQGDARHPPYNIRVNLAYCDPPTNHSKNQGNSDDHLNPDDYRNFAYQWLAATIFRLTLNSRLVLTLPTGSTRYLYEKILYDEFQMTLEQEIIWDYGFGLYTTKKFVPSHDNILVFKQGQPYFYSNQIKIRSQRQETGDPRANPLGRIPSDVWNIPRVSGNSFERRFLQGTDRTCQPLALCRRILLAYTQEDDRIYDPFAGSGTMAVIARQYKRNYYGLDICYRYVTEVKKRLKESWIQLL